MLDLNAWKKPTCLRLLIQWLFLFWCLYIGIQFGLFVGHFEKLGQAPFYPRPPSVEGFLPIGALVSLKSWLLTGYLDRVHPAALVLLLTILAMGLFARKSFCSFICPVGTLSEPAWRLGQKLFGRNFRIWRWLDLLLQAAKYGLLLFFVKLVLVDMPTAALKGFLNSPYWAIADVRMLAFFTDMSTTAFLIISTLVLLSIPFKNFWCRYLCPYGALLGLLAFASPFKIFRRETNCTGCGACSRACPALIDVQHKHRVYSPECTGCLTCVSRCPEQGALQMGLFNRPVSGYVFLVVVMAIFATGVLFGMVGDHWQTRLSYDDYRRLVPIAHRLGF